MAPKSKKEDSKNVKTSKVDNKTCVSSDNNTDKGRCLGRCLIIGITVVLPIAAVVLKVYLDAATVPDLPQVDLEEWWGSPDGKIKDTSIRKFRIMFNDGLLEFMRRKSDTYRKVTYTKSMKSVNDTWSYGVHSDTFAQIYSYWQFKYKNRDQVRFLNKFDHFKTVIQGLDIHFIHVKPNVEKNVKVLPLLLIHGWPGTVREFYEAIPLLTTVKPGYDFVFEVIVPSLPGFVHSQAPVRPGLNPFKVAIILRNLMHKLGFERFYVQGGDLGHIIGSHIATIFPEQVLGFHTSFPVNFSKYADLVWVLGAIWPSLVAKENVDKMYPLSEKISYILEETGYLHLQATKPDTIGIILQDSPVGLLSYTLDRILMFSDPNNKFLDDGGLSKFSSSNIIDIVMLYWSTNSITTALRLYKETFKSSELEQTLARIPTPVPTWGLRVKHEFFHSPDFVLRWKYPNLVGTTNLNIGGRYAAFEIPSQFTDDVFKAVQDFLKYNKAK